MERGMDVSLIRRIITDKARAHKDPPAYIQVEWLDLKGPRNQPLSKPEHNIDGLLEAELKQRRHAEWGETRTYKKRQAKDLSAATRNEIINQYIFGHVHMKDIASKYKISVSLVGRLVKQSDTKPDAQKLLLAKED